MQGHISRKVANYHIYFSPSKIQLAAQSQADWSTQWTTILQKRMSRHFIVEDGCINTFLRLLSKWRSLRWAHFWFEIYLTHFFYWMILIIYLTGLVPSNLHTERRRMQTQNKSSAHTHKNVMIHWKAELWILDRTYEAIKLTGNCACDRKKAEPAGWLLPNHGFLRSSEHHEN